MAGLCGDDFLGGGVGGRGGLVGWFGFCFVLGFVCFDWGFVFLVSVAFNVLFWSGFFWVVGCFGFFFFLDEISELNWYIVSFNKHRCKEAVAGVF